MRTAVVLFGVGVLVSMVGGAPVGASGVTHDGVTTNRRIIDLNGTWQVAEGAMDSIPGRFGHTVLVPGLIDMARPAFAGVGKKSERRQAFWYRRTLTVEGPIPDVAMLKLNKARYGTKVWLNGQLVGEHLPCFTPTYLDVKPHLKGSGQDNELIVRVGADRDALPAGQPTGWDFEKYLYIPGIYDDVALILTSEPFIRNVQVVPDIEAERVRIVAELQSSRSGSCTTVCKVSEAGSGKVVVTVERADVPFSGEGLTRLDITIPLEACRLWSPEDPFLYGLRLSTGGDEVVTRFGMRSFRFDRETGRAILNGKPYLMRGTNVCAYRFFEDAERGDKPWDRDWVRRLHERFKGMHWNSIRYCIGFPPELWYDVADEVGFLIQDEFPIWTLSEDPEKLTAEKIVPEYTEWMRERWNHPCVVIWDAQNESNTPETGKAINAVRHLDLSNRPWDNGWAEPQSEQDCVEAHPYLMIGLFNPAWGSAKVASLKDMVNVSPLPPLNEAQRKLKVPIIINEYAWLWLNRDGTPTCLTEPVYGKLLGPNSTTEERRLLFARYLAAKTEFWRSGRQCAGVLHFCGLGYSRAGDKPRPEGGATSDHFIDLEKLVFEPHFERYVGDAFAPVGVMLDYWGQDLPAGEKHEFEIVVTNDLALEREGNVRLLIRKGDALLARQEKPFRVDALGQKRLSFTQTVPYDPGLYLVMADLAVAGQEPVRSVRDLTVVAK
ncbi:glycoside hydrolase family 2 protein [Anaerobaca lacustris]|uniref:Glycoside hydrolase family 2 TIM barrel-domain containing protein n=1 Tax=Anaerobaca lacustris TaxID=3044600 RepID=A0AAW6TV65_9BACT|nr:glycoside hydrolase family 2 TIM barrel-domain containing protein [Sedimentisphaerales bacterium M17dextr]